MKHLFVLILVISAFGTAQAEARYRSYFNSDAHGFIPPTIAIVNTRSPSAGTAPQVIPAIVEAHAHSMVVCVDGLRDSGQAAHAAEPPL